MPLNQMPFRPRELIWCSWEGVDGGLDVLISVGCWVRTSTDVRQTNPTSGVGNDTNTSEQQQQQISNKQGTTSPLLIMHVPHYQIPQKLRVAAQLYGVPKSHCWGALLGSDNAFWTKYSSSEGARFGYQQILDTLQCARHNSQRAMWNGKRILEPSTSVESPISRCVAPILFST